MQCRCAGCRPQAERLRTAVASLANASCSAVSVVQRLGVSHAGPQRPTVLDGPQAKSIRAKWAEASISTCRAIKSARLHASPELVDKLKHLEGEEHVCLFAWVDRHAEVACSRRDDRYIQYSTQTDRGGREDGRSYRLLRSTRPQPAYILGMTTGRSQAGKAWRSRLKTPMGENEGGGEGSSLRLKPLRGCV
jgi:hypothetical protein